MSESTILNCVKNRRAANFLTLDYDRHRKVWVLGQELRHENLNFRVIEESERREWLVDAVIDALLQADKWRLLEHHAGIVYLPLFLYDHSGITMNVDGFNDPWDSGQVGYIYTDKKTIMQNVGGYYVGNNVDGRFVKTTERNWKKVAYHDMESEVSIYDQYLTGQVYGIITEEFDTDTGTWEEQDSCWGYFSDKWGDDLIEEIASEYGITEELHDKAEAA